MKKVICILSVIFLMSGCFLVDDPSYRDDWECPENPILGIYKRNLKGINTSPPIRLEYFQLINDSTYSYYYLNLLGEVSFQGKYEFRNLRRNDYKKDWQNKRDWDRCEIIFHDFQFVNNLTGEYTKDTVFRCIYGVTADSAIIDSDFELDAGEYVLKR